MPRGVKLQKLVDTACSLDHRVMLLQLAQSHVGSILGALASPHHMATYLLLVVCHALLIGH